jgi:polysaccharide pyruvyl transferase WcaK-like protein
MSCVIAHLVTAHDADVVVFSMNRPPAADDRAFAARLCSALPEPVADRVRVLGSDYSPARLKALVGRMDVFIGTRLHPSRFALSAGVPTLTLHDRDKVRGLMEMAGKAEWHLPVTGSASGTVIRAVDRLIEHRVTVRGRIGARVPELVRLAKRNLDRVGELARSAPDGVAR